MEMAKRIQGFRDFDKNASGRWRVRRLPSEKNAEAGYRMRGFEILTSAPDEEKLASVLKAALLESGIPGGGQEFEIRQTTQNTPWYLSVFVCPESA